jgi:hypothetical protein
MNKNYNKIKLRQMDGNKNKNNKFNLNSKRYKINRLYKTIDPFSTKSKVLCTDNVSIIATNGAPDIIFSNGFNYYNLANLSTLTDFTEQSDSYFFAKIDSLCIDLIRACDETTMQSATFGTNIYLAFLPNARSTTPSYASLARNQSAYQIDTMTFDPQKIVIPMPDVSQLHTTGGVDYWLNSSHQMLVSHIQYLVGQLAINTNNTTNHGATVLSLFNLKLKFRVTFAFRA